MSKSAEFWEWRILTQIELSTEIGNCSNFNSQLLLLRDNLSLTLISWSPLGQNVKNA